MCCRCRLVPSAINIWITWIIRLYGRGWLCTSDFTRPYVISFRGEYTQHANKLTERENEENKKSCFSQSTVVRSSPAPFTPRRRPPLSLTPFALPLSHTREPLVAVPLSKWYFPFRGRTHKHAFSYLLTQLNAVLVRTRKVRFVRRLGRLVYLADQHFNRRDYVANYGTITILSPSLRIYLSVRPSRWSDNTTNTSWKLHRARSPDRGKHAVRKFHGTLSRSGIYRNCVVVFSLLFFTSLLIIRRTSS